MVKKNQSPPPDQHAKKVWFPPPNTLKILVLASNLL